MIGKRIYFGKTVDEAIEKGLKELGITREEAEIQILEEPSKGLFGLIGSKPAKVEIEVKVDPVKEATNFLSLILAQMGITASIQVNHRKEGIYFNISGKNLGTIIGYHGQTLDALQNLVNAVAGRYGKGRERIILDAENYREKRSKSLEELADRVVRQVLRTKQSVKLEPMSANERRIIHTHLQHRAHIVTESEGEEPHRSVVIKYKDK